MRGRAQHGDMAEEMPDPPDLAGPAAAALGPESRLIEDLDAAGFADALARVVRQSAANPGMPAQAAVRLAADLGRIPVLAATHWLGRDIDPPVAPDPKD